MTDRCPTHDCELTTGGCLVCAAERYLFRCPYCGEVNRIGAGHFCAPSCPHIAPLSLPTFHMSGGALLQLRQCRDCKLIGVVGNDCKVIWMLPPKLEMKGTPR